MESGETQEVCLGSEAGSLLHGLAGLPVPTCLASASAN